MTQPQDVARIVAFLLDLPDTASIAEIPINSTLEDSW
jgi:NADP-dependent 3-hydroxy acid dehydrogenase YdfG